MSTANWPIRVGGEYPFRHNRDHKMRVIADLDGEFAAEFLAKEGRVFQNHFVSNATVIRALCLPEDESPIPALVEALQAAQNLVEELVAQASSCMAHVGVSERGQEWVRKEMRVYGEHLAAPIKAALAKAEGKTTALPETEEVPA